MIDDAFPIPASIRAMRSADMRVALVVCAAWLDRQAKLCAPCKGLGRIPDVWEARQVCGLQVRVQKGVAGVGVIWEDCEHSRQFRHLANRCRGVKL